MSSRAATQFQTELVRLFRARTRPLVTYIWPQAGSAPRITRKRIRNSIAKLRTIAEDDYLSSRDARRIFADRDYKRQWHAKKNKGHGARAKTRAFKRWYENAITTKNSVYVFWNGKQCLYVGRTLNGKGRALLILRSIGSERQKELTSMDSIGRETFRGSNAC
jgi:hypothetical protein